MPKTVNLKTLSLENYKGVTRVDNAQFYKRTVILGKNAIGKTTLCDAYMDIMTGKLFDGQAAERVRPHDKNGKDVDYVPIRRSITIDIDGEEAVVEKITNQKWRVPRGQTEEVFDGNITTYKINGFDKKAKEYEEWKDNIIDADTLLMCSNASVFLNKLAKSTAEARKTLESVSGWSVENFINSNPEYSAIKGITKGNTIEDTLKQLRKNLSAEKKSLEKLRTQLSYESDKQQEHGKSNVTALETQKKELNEQIEALNRDDAALDIKGKEAAELKDELIKLNDALRLVEMRLTGENAKQKQTFREAVYQYDRSLAAHEAEIKRLKEKIFANKTELERQNILIEDSRDKYKQARDSKFDVSKSDCPYCGQKLPEEKIKDAIQKFEAEKQAQLDTIENQGKGIRAIVNQLKADITEATKRLEVEELKIKELTEKSKVANERIVEIGEVDLNTNAEYQNIKTQIATVTDRLSNIPDTEAERATIRTRRNGLISVRLDVEKQIAAITTLGEVFKQNIEKLKADITDEAQRCADIERDLAALINFSIEKNKNLADTINKHFKHFHFDFLEYTQEGNPVETCKMIVNGTSYSEGLNGGDKKLVEIDLCRGLQELNDICLPIWVDEANTIDSWRLPKDMEQQLIIIMRTDSDDLEVKEMEG